MQNNYVFNPRARLKFTIGTPVKEEGYKVFNYHKLGDEGFKQSVLAFRDTGLWDSLLTLIEIPESISLLPSQHLEVFEKMGIILPRENLALPVFFHVFIGDELPSLLPAYSHSDIPENLTLNKNLTFQWQLELPDAVNPYIFSQELLSTQRPVIWVPDDITQIYFPYWLTPELAHFLSGNPSQQELQALPLNTKKLLHLANILLEPTKNHAVISSEELQEQLEKQEFLVLRKFLPPLQVAVLRHYIRQLKAEGYFFINEDKQVKLRDYIYNDQLMSFFHIQMTRYLNTILPDNIQPSFTFLCYYNPGSVLERHTDREQCAWNVSLCVDMEPEYSLEHVWPIYIEANGGNHKVMLELGDAVLYRGTENDHWRDALPESDQVSMSLFHFVDFDFSGDLT